jgi:8-oxo-dGTP diphosphatase
MSTIPVFGTRVEGQTYLHRPSAYALVRNARGEFAVARTPVAHYLPGGGIDPGETPEQAVVREGREECGFVLQPRDLLARAIEICYSAEEKQYFEKDSFFIEADVVGHAAQTELDHELLWLKAEDAIAKLSHESHRWAISRLNLQRP